LGLHSDGASMRETISVMIPHRLGKDEALRRIKNGIAEARTTFASVLTVKEETWTGDTLAFRVSALMQETAGTIAVAENNVKLDVELPWLLAKLAKVIAPAIKKEGTLMLEKK
jgi:Putative polyhydroxyalkanoic acid system protein (PHA_gran_rgn)